MSRTLDQIFTQLGIPHEALKQARQRQAGQGGSLRENLIALDLLSEDSFAQKVNEHFRVPYVHPRKSPIADEALALLPREKAEKYSALPLQLDPRHRRLTIAMADPSDMSTIDELKFVIGHTLLPHYTPEDELSEIIQQEYSRLEDSQTTADAWITREQAAGPAIDEQPPLIDVATLTTGETAIGQLIGEMFTVAHAKRASELHLEPNSDGFRLCLRIDGKLSEIVRLPKNFTTPLLTRMRRILGIEITERSSLVQKGFALVKLKNKKELDISYHLYPTIHSDAILIKIKDRFALPSLEDLMLAPKILNTLQKVLDAPNGMLLITGTAKGGMTTTLYSFLHSMDTPHRNLLSLENPVEILLPEMTQGQTQLETEHGVLQSLLTAFGQRPDVLMIDRIANPTHFQQLVRLASGTLVLSSFPAIDAASAAIELTSMSSVELVTTHVNCITSQRLVRRICDICKEEVVLPETHREKLGLSPNEHCFSGKGCDLCEDTGYKGVIPIFEVMCMTDSVKQALMRGCTVNELRTLNAEQQVLSLRDDGMRKVKKGITTLQEVLKATML